MLLSCKEADTHAENTGSHFLWGTRGHQQESQAGRRDQSGACESRLDRRKPAHRTVKSTGRTAFADLGLKRRPTGRDHFGVLCHRNSHRGKTDAGTHGHRRWGIASCQRMRTAQNGFPQMRGRRLAKYANRLRSGQTRIMKHSTIMSDQFKRE